MTALRSPCLPIARLTARWGSPEHFRFPGNRSAGLTEYEEEHSGAERAVRNITLPLGTGPRIEQGAP
ncbi:hypothetical protein ACIHFE_19280 [Streptomyces sp. NPDC052396]|uniref:hypothetical protein n=1 Tax=Streptomyces sp. NPDC052396 TaxID=3365689 RepID=UPI0037D0FFCD